MNLAPLISIVMGSISDLPVMRAAADLCKEFDVQYEMSILSAHRTPFEMVAYGRQAKTRGLNVIIAGAGGAAHLPGMLASCTPIPVIGVPIKSKALSGIDSLLSIVQMPAGIPVATVAIDNAKNAALLAISILALQNQELMKKLEQYREEMASISRESNQQLSND